MVNQMQYGRAWTLEMMRRLLIPQNWDGITGTITADNIIAEDPIVSQHEQAGAYNKAKLQTANH